MVSLEITTITVDAMAMVIYDVSRPTRVKLALLYFATVQVTNKIWRRWRDL